jgi:hypothetical protein
MTNLIIFKKKQLSSQDQGSSSPQQLQSSVEATEETALSIRSHRSSSPQHSTKQQLSAVAVSRGHRLEAAAALSFLPLLLRLPAAVRYY